MKKYLFLAALASVALASCVDDESNAVVDAPQPLRFDAPMMTTQTRANVMGEIDGIKYPTEENFKVFCWNYTGNFNGLTESTNITSYFSPQGEIAKHGYSTTGTSTYWVTETVHYWPEDGHNLAFAAFSPGDFTVKDATDATDVSGITVKYDEKGLSITNFVVQDKADYQYDLMYTDIVKDKNKVNNGSSAVKLDFKHALSSIVFSSQRADENVHYTIDDIEISGKFHTEGTFCQNLNGEAGWTVDGAIPNTSKTYEPSFDKFDVPVENPAQFTKGTSALLMIPQSLENKDVKVKVTYTKTTNPDTSSAESLQSVREINLLDFKTAGEEYVDTWEIGKRYVYRIAFGQNKRIYFEPSITQWEQQETMIYTIE